MRYGAAEVARASSFWALPSKVQNDTPVLTLATAADVRSFNGSLPCGSRLVSARGARAASRSPSSS